jgi:UPF0755 protein
MMSRLLSWLRPRWRQLLVGTVLLIVTLAGGRYWLFQQRLNAPLNLQSSYILNIAPGSNFTRLIRQLREAGIVDNEDLLYYVRYHDLANRIRAGEYELVAGMTPLALLQLVLDGKVIEYQIRLGEGWTLREALLAVQAHPAITTTLDAHDPAALQTAFGTMQYPEGGFFPETYNFTRGTTDRELMRRAKALMDATLARAWAERDAGLPYMTEYEVLVMASIIEKETGLSSEQAEIAGVFVRRLQQNMRLQTDPTVIYGIANFDGNLTRAHLQADTPYNSYTRAGLPPTPIALPGRGAIFASVHPAQGDALYFVAKGDGSHYFSATLEEHNAAVKRYQLGQPQ